MIIRGVIAALGNRDWAKEFNLSPRGFFTSFFAVFMYVPLSFVVARAAVKYNDVAGHVPYKAIGAILILVSLTFPVLAFLLCAIFDKRFAYQPWVIVRNWSVLFAWLIMATAFGLYLLGLAPFSVAFFVGMSSYLGTLAVDIRLAARVAGFDWVGAAFIGVLISVVSIYVLFTGFSQAIG